MSAIDVLNLETLLKPLGSVRRFASEVLRIAATWPEPEIEETTPGELQKKFVPTINLGSLEEYKPGISEREEKQPIHTLVAENNEFWGLTPDIATLYIYLDFLEASFVQVEHEADGELHAQDFLIEPEELRILLNKGFPYQILDAPSGERLEDYLKWRGEAVDTYAEAQIFSDKEKEG
jgi:hypothetical protein